MIQHHATAIVFSFLDTIITAVRTIFVHTHAEEGIRTLVIILDLNRRIMEVITLIVRIHITVTVDFFELTKKLNSVSLSIH